MASRVSWRGSATTMGNDLADVRRSKHAIAVVTNKSWYEGFVPLFIYFTQRAYPDTDTLVFTMGEIDPLIPATLQALACDAARYRLIADFGKEFGQSSLIAKTARWVVPLERETEGYEALYVGDIDMLLAREASEDLFAQHLAHSRKLGIPISNMIRASGDRLTGLHFMRLPEYRDQAKASLSVLRDLLIDTRDKHDAISTLYPNSGGDEKALYAAVARANMSWIDALRQSTFRPHHGVHLGLFRNEGRIGDVLIQALRENEPNMPRYWQDVAPELDRTIASGLWTELFAAYPRVETSCWQFLEFHRDWRAGKFDGLLTKPAASRQN